MKDSLITIFSGSEIEVILLQGELENNGIATSTSYGTYSGVSPYYGGAPVSLDLTISELDLAKARPIIDEYLQNRDSEK
ncbi:MAG: hypothetical protein WC699_11340 [Bacteroidales bacterium]|jgi:hypothetical protein